MTGWWMKDTIPKKALLVLLLVEQVIEMNLSKEHMELQVISCIPGFIFL